jgi:hypothetical protein
MISTIRLPMTPPSLNAVAGRSNRWAFSRPKKQWQRDLAVALMAIGVPRNLHRVEASAVLSFTTARRRDEGNFRVILEKALGDALVEGGWLEDDTPDHFRFGAVDFAQADAPETRVLLGIELVRPDGVCHPPHAGEDEKTCDSVGFSGAPAGDGLERAEAGFGGAEGGRAQQGEVGFDGVPPRGKARQAKVSFSGVSEGVER